MAQGLDIKYKNNLRSVEEFWNAEVPQIIKYFDVVYNIKVDLNLLGIWFADDYQIVVISFELMRTIDGVQEKVKSWMINAKKYDGGWQQIHMFMEVPNSYVGAVDPDESDEGME
jgi:hypothetical protein